MKVYLDEGAFMPERAHELDAGYDLRTPEDVTVSQYGNVIINTGVHVAIPKGYVGMLKSKSGLNVKSGITGEGVIDSGYTGAIVAKLYSNSNQVVKFNRGDKIIQLVLLPIYTPNLEKVDSIEEFGDSERGENGFGSTGR